VRHVIQILVGVPLTYFCFGRFDKCCILFSEWLLLNYLTVMTMKISSP